MNYIPASCLNWQQCNLIYEHAVPTMAFMLIMHQRFTIDWPLTPAQYGKQISLWIDRITLVVQVFMLELSEVISTSSHKKFLNYARLQLCYW